MTGSQSDNDGEQNYFTSRYLKNDFQNTKLSETARCEIILSVAKKNTILIFYHPCR